VECAFDDASHVPQLVGGKSAERRSQSVRCSLKKRFVWHAVGKDFENVVELKVVWCKSWLLDLVQVVRVGCSSKLDAGKSRIVAHFTVLLFFFTQYFGFAY